jgi:hypothetical protein
MPHRAASPAIVLLALACSAAWAQTAPPIKPGLWEIKSEREVDGKKAPDPSERMKTMSPEVRAKVEAMMKEKGVAMGTGMATHICLSRESLDQGNWQSESSNCKTNVTSRSSSTWKWHSVCTQPVMENDGQAVFANSENYTVTSNMKMMMQGQERLSKTTINAKWLGDNCGDLKPVMRKP